MQEPIQSGKQRMEASLRSVIHRTASTIKVMAQLRIDPYVLGTSALWGIVAVPFVAGTVVELTLVKRTDMSLEGFLRTLLTMYFLGVLPSVLLSVFGGIWLHRMAQKHKKLELLAFSAAAGIVLSVLFFLVPASLFMLFMWGGGDVPLLWWWALWSRCPLIGGVSGISYAAAFHSLLLKRNDW